MIKSRLVCLMLTLSCLLTLCAGVSAAQVDCDATYCFSASDFSEKEELVGICITDLPAPSAGTVMLGNRVIRAGDILTSQQVAQMTFCPLQTKQDTQATVDYLPVYSDRVEQKATMTISIRGKENKAPTAEDSAMETYKNLPNNGKLKANDPEGENLTFTLLRQPKRGAVAINEDGSFTYTPKKNKVGVDSFTYTATDPSGNVSREATVTVQILKPTDKHQYTDTIGHECRFAAEWMRNTGLFEGEKVGSAQCFHPDKAVSRGEFLTMLVQVLNIPTEEASATAIPEDTPQWLKPYMAAALRAGLTAGLPETESGSFEPDMSITGAEAAVMLQNALDLSVSQQALESAAVGTSAGEGNIPAWAQVSLSVMEDNGITLEADEMLTRGDVAQVMYRVSYLSAFAPGAAVIRMQN